MNSIFSKSIRRTAAVVLILMTVICCMTPFSIAEEALCLQCGLVTDCNAAAYIRSGDLGNSVTYTVDNDGVMTISGMGEMFDYAACPFSKDKEVLRLVKILIVKEGVTSFGTNVIDGMKHLVDIYLPVSLKKVNKNAVINCPSVDNIYYAGDSDQWDAIRIDSSNTVLGTTFIHYNIRTESQLSEILGGESSEIWGDPELASSLRTPRFELEDNLPLIIISIVAVVVVIGGLCGLDIYKRIQKDKKDREKAARKAARAKAAKEARAKEAAQQKAESEAAIAQVRAEAEKAREEAEKAKAEAEKAKAEAEKARAEAEKARAEAKSAHHDE